jgi:hypothetical protein
MAPCTYVVGLTTASEQTYTRLQCLAEHHLLRGDATNSHVAIFRKLEEILERVIPQDPFNRERVPCVARSRTFLG